MIHIIFVIVLICLFVQMVHLPPKAYKKLLCRFAEIEEERFVPRFCFTNKSNKELDRLSDQLLDTINAPVIFFLKNMHQWFLDCLVVVSLYLFILLKIEFVTIIGIRIIFSSILAVCLFIFSAHLILLEKYKKEARKDIKKRLVEKEREDQKELDLFIKRTSAADYDTPEAE